MKYRYLLIDHDDTSVDSSPSIHHPAHLEQMKQLGRESESVGADEWMKINYDPGIQVYLDSVLKLNEQEKKLCYTVWREYARTRIPEFFPGILPIMEKFRGTGGIIVVVTHSEADMVRMHYQHQREVPGFLPDRIIGWTGDSLKNKPNPWPVFDVMREYSAQKQEILVVDDLKPGITMAQRAGVDSLGAGWSHHIPEIMEDMKKNCTYYAETLQKFRDILFNTP